MTTRIIGISASAGGLGTEAGSDTQTQRLISDLGRENRDLRERLQSLSGEHETALAELRSSNERLHSVNEELQTVNAQLSSKVDELNHASADLRNLFESTRVATLFLDQHMVIRAYTPELGTIYNLIPSDRGRPITDIVGRVDYDQLRDDVLDVMNSLQPVERRVSRRDQTAHYLLRILPYRAPDSTIDGSLMTFVDVTQIVQAEKHQRLLVDELNHRVKNMLTVVISLATQTIKRSPSLQEFSATFLGRVQALTAAYTLLTRENWSSVNLDEVIGEELKPYLTRDRKNIKVAGPTVALDPRGALALGLALHELATNAFKYGSLSVPEGTLAVTWVLKGEGCDKRLFLSWIEQNGPKVVAPEKRGFGSTLIERALVHEISAEAGIEFLPEGVRVNIQAPMRSGTHSFNTLASATP